MRKKLIFFGLLIVSLIISAGVVVFSTSKNKDNNSAAVEQTATEYEPVLTQNREYPDYYEQEVRDTIKTIRSKSTGESISYIFITDLHLDTSEQTEAAAYRQLNAVVDVANNTDIDFVCVGGDIHNGRHAEENGKQVALDIIDSVSEVLKKCNKPVFILKGNHDDNSFSAQVNLELLYAADYIINREEWYSVTMSHFSQYAQDYQNGYFYYDIPDKNVRVVCLNMSDSDDTVTDGKQAEMGMYYYGYKDEQIDWLLNKAFSREDCKYLIMCHDEFSYPQGYNENSNREVLRGILAAAYTHINYSDGKFQKDFSNWGGELVLYNCGHMHMTRLILDKQTGGLPIISTEQSMFQANKRVWGQFGSSGYSVIGGRKENTASEALFDIVISKENDIEIIKFGAGYDKRLTY